MSLGLGGECGRRCRTTSARVDGMKPKMEEALRSHCQPKWPQSDFIPPEKFRNNSHRGGGGSQRRNNEDLDLVNIWGETTTQVKHTIVCLHCIMTYKSDCKHTRSPRTSLSHFCKHCAATEDVRFCSGSSICSHRSLLWVAVF